MVWLAPCAMVTGGLKRVGRTRRSTLANTLQTSLRGTSSWRRALMRKCGEEVREFLHDGCPVACLGDAPLNYVNVFTAHVNLAGDLSLATTVGHYSRP